MVEKKRGLIRRFFSGVWRIYTGFRSVILNLLFILFIVLIFSAIFSGDKITPIPQTAALTLNLRGDLVEEKRWVDPVSQIMNQGVGSLDESPEILVSDVITVIEKAAQDDRIQVIVLDLSNLGRASLDKLQRIGDAINTFKTTGKKVFAYGGFFLQHQYFLASYADEINLTPMGAVLLEGYGTYPMYYRQALEKLKINTYVFRVGTYKSFVEPFIRDDMSDEAKEANIAWLTELWSDYKQQVADRRGFSVSNFDETYDSILSKMQQVNGDTAEYALNNAWVDHIKTSEQFNQQLIDMVGRNRQSSYNNISFSDYAGQVIPPQIPFNTPSDKVAVIIARGTIVDGSAKAGTIGGDSTAALLRRARFDNSVKAVVLRIDSPGGSGYASEIIRQEVTALREAGKPVIASMGEVAASGGYWIASPANEIWASPTTITGSIGIFGMLYSAEHSLAALGLNVDGVGTTELAGLSSGLFLYKGLPDKAQQLFQLYIEDGYRTFLELVSHNRNMTIEQADAVAQGRVWTGRKAQELGLVDKLGTLDDAIVAASEKAGLGYYEIKKIEHELTPTEQFVKNLLGEVSLSQWLPEISLSPERKMLRSVSKAIQQEPIWMQLNDPKGIYAYCLACIPH